MHYERLMLDAPSLPEHWNCAYAVTKARRNAFLSSARHPDSFFKPTSETATTVFMLGRLEGWAQAQLALSDQAISTPRGKDDTWSPSFFKRFASDWNSHSPRFSPLGSFLAERLALDPNLLGDPFLLFEVRTFNNAFNGGKTIRNPSFLAVSGEWSRFDALVIFPIARTLVFFECKVESDGTHGASGHELAQPIRNLETAFFLTVLSDSQYCGWDFRYVLLCPRNELGGAKECERFFVDGHASELAKYDGYLSSASNALLLCPSRTTFHPQWQSLRENLKDKLAIIYWNDLLDAICEGGFDPNRYFEQIDPIAKDGQSLVIATKQRWNAAGLKWA